MNYAYLIYNRFRGSIYKYIVLTARRHDIYIWSLESRRSEYFSELRHILKRNLVINFRSSINLEIFIVANHNLHSYQFTFE